MKNIRNILAKGVFMLLVSLLAMACTEKSDWGIDASYSRPFGTNEDGINVTKDEKVARVTVTWDAMPGVEYYILEISKNELTDEIPMGSEENGNLVYGNTVENRILKAPFLIDNLEAGAEYYLRIKSVANGKESYWAYLDEPFKTVTEEDVLNVPAEEDLPVASGKVRMSWEAGLTVTHFEIVGGAAPIERAITAEEAAAGEAWIEGLKIFTAYTISIYNNETLRGSQEVVVPGLEIESTVDEITANTARFSWDNTVDVDQYICQPSSAPTPDDATGAVSLSVSEVNEHAVIIPNLEPSTEYTVYAFYNGAICARATFTTKRGTNSFTAENILFAGSGSVKIFNKTSDAPGIINGSKIYSSSDLTVANAGEVSTTALSYSSSQLFPNASSSTDVLDLTFGADIPNEVKIIGDPRWNK